MQVKEIKRFIGGGLNLDVEPSLLPSTDTTYRINAVVDEETGALVNAKGNDVAFDLSAGLPIPLPGGDEIFVLGTHEWMSDNSVIIIAVTTSSIELIWKYSRITETATLIYEGTGVIGLDPDYPINHMDVVGGILYWTDGHNPPAKVNIQKAIDFMAGTGGYTYMTAQTFSAGQYVPSYPPEVYFSTDATIAKNNLRGTQFQFCYRYIMEDNEITATSPVSKIAIPPLDETDDSFVDNINTNNFIGVEIIPGNELVKTIELFARNGNTGDWTLIKRLNKEQYNIDDSATETFLYRFFNDVIPEGATQDDINAVTDNFPILADTQEVIDESIMAYGGLTEGYDQVDVDIVLTPKSIPTDFKVGTGVTVQTFTMVEGDDADGPYLSIEIIIGSPTNGIPVVDSRVELSVEYELDDGYGGTTHQVLMERADKTTPSDVLTGGTDLEKKTAFLQFISRLSPMPYSIIIDSGTGDAEIRLYAPNNLVSWTSHSLITRASSLIAEKRKKTGFKHGAIHPIGLVYFDELRRSAGVHASPTTDVFVPFYSDPKYTGVVNVATTSTIEDITASWITNEYAGQWVKMTSGGAIGESLRINSHDATHLQLQGTFSVAPVPTDTFVILSNSSREQAGIDWQIKHQPPSWATHYAWVYAGNQTMSKWVQYIANGIIEDPSMAPISDSKYAEYSMISIEPLNKHTVDGIDYIYPQSSVVPYVFTKGDRVRIITEDGSAYSTEDKPLGNAQTSYLDYEILGYQDDDPTTNYLVVPKIDISDINLQANSKFLVEIYSPRNDVSTRVYYEIGEIYDIGDPGTGARYHKGQYQNQDPLNLSGVPARGTLFDGDSYIYLRSFSAKIPTTGSDGRVDVVESQHMSDLYDSDSYSIGKAFLELSNPQQKKYKFIRWSNKYFADTQINGFSKFPSSNRTKQLDEEYGEIYKIEQVGFTLRVLQARKPSTIYIGRDSIISDTGAETISISSDVLTNIRPQASDLGTVLPESVVSHGNITYFFDIYNGKMCRMDVNGVDAISDLGMRQYFRDKSTSLLASGITNIRVLCAYDKSHDSLIVTFLDSITSANQDTIIFHEPSQRWISWASFVPELYATIGDKLYSLYDGILYQHDMDSVNRMYYYGVQYSFEETLISNINPNNIRTLESIELITNNNKYVSDAVSWAVDNVVTPSSDQYSYGQWSKIPASRFVPKQGRLYAEFLRDKYSAGYPGTSYYLVNGRKLRGDLFYITLKHTSVDKVILHGVVVNSAISAPV